MAKATTILSSSTCPTMGDLHMVFLTILNILHDILNRKEIGILIIEDDSLRDYFQKYCNEKFKKNLLEEYLAVPKEN
ncbi:9658_t:CDS:2, partial [Gigaspora margarita]